MRPRPDVFLTKKILFCCTQLFPQHKDKRLISTMMSQITNIKQHKWDNKHWYQYMIDLHKQQIGKVIDVICFVFWGRPAPPHLPTHTNKTGRTKQTKQTKEQSINPSINRSINQSIKWTMKQTMKQKKQNKTNKQKKKQTTRQDQTT